MAAVEHKLDFEHTADTLEGVYGEISGENWPRYNGTVLYCFSLVQDYPGM